MIDSVEDRKLTAEEIHALATSPLPVFNVFPSECRGSFSRNINKYYNDQFRNENISSIVDNFQQSNSKNYK